jgi:hypothetical protein
MLYPLHELIVISIPALTGMWGGGGVCGPAGRPGKIPAPATNQPVYSKPSGGYNIYLAWATEKSIVKKFCCLARAG